MNAPDNAQVPRTDVAVAVVERDDRYLIGMREEGVALAGCWEFPGGKVKPQETPAAAAVRECLEETGLVVRVVGDYPTAQYDYEHARVRLHFFACACVAQQRALPGRFRWVTAAELSRFVFPPANAALLSRLTAGKTA
ncbi:MAG: (deoxy)nucleoside triphosphate pyrophosphohydrolase [Pirellulales bacterium]